MKGWSLEGTFGNNVEAVIWEGSTNFISLNLLYTCSIEEVEE